MLAHGEGEDPHLPGQESAWRKDQTGPNPPRRLQGSDLRPHRLIGVVFLEDLLCLFLSAIGEEHDDLITVGPRNVHLCVCVCVKGGNVQEVNTGGAMSTYSHKRSVQAHC